MYLRTRISGLRLRAVHAVQWWPRRLQRLGQHLGQFCWQRGSWWVTLLCLLADVLAFPELYETLFDLSKWGSRPLSPSEVQLLQEVFGTTLPYARIRIDERAYLGPPQWRVCYVSFTTINSWGAMPADILVHEAVHVWQFMQWGSAYIPRALAAQRSAMGYNYGGRAALERARTWELGLAAFNAEQQADIITDYWRLRHRLPPRWLREGQPTDLALLQTFVDELSAPSAPTFE